MAAAVAPAVIMVLPILKFWQLLAAPVGGISTWWYCIENTYCACIPGHGPPLPKQQSPPTNEVTKVRNPGGCARVHSRFEVHVGHSNYDQLEI